MICLALPARRFCLLPVRPFYTNGPTGFNFPFQTGLAQHDRAASPGLDLHQAQGAGQRGELQAGVPRPAEPELRQDWCRADGRAGDPGVPDGG